MEIAETEIKQRMITLTQLQEQEAEDEDEEEEEGSVVSDESEDELVNDYQWPKNQPNKHSHRKSR